MEKGLSYWQLPGEKPEAYKKLGVKTYKKYLPTNGDLIRQRLWARLGIGEFGGLDKSKGQYESLAEYLRATKLNEVLHLGSLSVIGFFQVKAGTNMEAQAVYGSVQVLGNIYPIMVQRYNRLRAVSLMNRIEERNRQTGNT